MNDEPDKEQEFDIGENAEHLGFTYLFFRYALYPVLGIILFFGIVGAALYIVQTKQIPPGNVILGIAAVIVAITLIKS